MDKQSKIILISGPTASGKSNFAVKIAKKIEGEIINADSMQIYKKLKILTARPIKQEQKNIKHHLYGFVDLNEKFSTGQWLELTIKKIEKDTDRDNFLDTTAAIDYGLVDNVLDKREAVNGK